MIVIISVIGGFAWYNTQLSPASEEKSEKTFLILKGQGVSSIAENLKAEGLIKNETAFKLYIKQQNLEDKLQAGSFKISPSMSSKEIAQNLQKGALEVWVTLLEGWRVEEMAQKLATDLDANSEEFATNSKEGYMFPDTYLLPKEISMKQIALMMRDNFDKKYTPELRAKIRAQGLTEDEGVILASIVEREARSQEVRTEVAGILLKRLNIDMGLNADATLQYMLGFQPKEKSWWKRNLSNADKLIDSPYNTYKYRGLPPAPICNPSLSSLKAVADANPKTPYLYYFHDDKGNTYYAKTLEEHNQNVARHR